MLSVRRLREITATLRFQLVMWISIVVFVTVAVKNIAVREVEQYLLRHSYDEFLLESLEDVHSLLAKLDKGHPVQVSALLNEKVQSNDYRSWFVQLFDARGRFVWGSSNAPAMPPPTLKNDVTGPYDYARHRVLERKLRKDSGEWYYLRCGFQQVALQDDIGLVNKNLLLASISILIFAPLVGYVIAVRATRPIAQIIEAASHLQPSNMSERLPIRGTGDELDQLSHTINGMLDRLAAFIDQNRDFVANAAHELRSPLTAIRSSVEVGLNRSRTPEEYAAILIDVMEEITRLAGLVNRLLLLAEGDAGRFKGRDQAAWLDRIVQESVEMFEAVAELKGVRLTVEKTMPLLVPGDETYLRQVVRNLIDNAIKYNKEPGEVFLRLDVDRVKKQALFVIKDTGMGIDRALLPRIFERFYRADKSRARDQEKSGYGLGLSICQSVIHGLNGSITVESEIGAGSTFTIRLPLLDESSAPAPSGEKPILSPAGS